MASLLSFLWLIRTTKAVLFWLYLWQLKEYHLGRFLDHFRTEKGKKLLLNKINLIKIILLSVFFFAWLSDLEEKIFLPVYQQNLPFHLQFLEFLIVFASLALLILYLFESLWFIHGATKKRIKLPILTKKTGLLILIAISVQILFLFYLFLFLKLQNILLFGSYLLIFDILIPLIVSVIVLVFQPLAVLGRNQIIRKAKKKREQFKELVVIGIAGSYGKTSTKEFLATILAEKYKVLKTKKHQNSEVGVSLCILNDLRKEHEIFICEMGAYNKGGIKLLCDIAKPKIGILTGINEQHMATFGSQENIIKAKYELIQSLPEDGLAIFNGNNHQCLELYKNTRIKKRICSLQSLISGAPTDVWAHNIKTEKDFINFKLYSKDGSVDLKVNLLGEQNVENILMSVCCAKELGMDLEEIARACQKIEKRHSGIQLKEGINGLNIINATYSANPNGVISHLEYLKIWEGKKVIVMPCLIELGKASREIHKRIGEKIAQICDLTIITTKERFKDIKDGSAGSPREVEVLFMENPKKILEKIQNFSREGDVVLLESRVPDQLIKQLII